MPHGRGDDETPAAPREATSAGSTPFAASSGPAAIGPGVGARLGPYVLVSLLGEGGMGRVFRARDERLGRDVALKLLRPDRTDGSARFEREIEAASRVKHVNVVRIHAAGEESGVRYLVTELVEGETLASIVAREGALAPLRAARIGLGLARALEALHAEGVLHRDVKPSNVLMDESGAPRLTDFGLAKVVDADPLTHTTTLLGTPLYAPLEQMEGREIDERADLFALGTTLYELTAGVLPWRPAGIIELYEEKKRPPSPPSIFRADGDRTLDDICLRCLERDPDDRFESADELALALEGVSTRRLPSRRRAPVGLVSVLALVALAAVVALGRTARDRDPIESLARSISARCSGARSIRELDLGSLGSAVAALGTATAGSPAGASAWSWFGLAALGHGDLETAARAGSALEAATLPEAAALRGGLAVIGGGDAGRAVRDLETAQKGGIALRELDGWRLRAMLRRTTDAGAASEVQAELARLESRGIRPDGASELEAECRWRQAMVATDDALLRGDVAAALRACARETGPPSSDSSAAQRTRRILELLEPALGALRQGPLAKDRSPAEASRTVEACLDLWKRVAPSSRLPAPVRATLAEALTDPLVTFPHELALAAAELAPDDDALVYEAAVRLTGKDDSDRLERIARRAAAHGPLVRRVEAHVLVVRILVGRGRPDDGIAESELVRREIEEAAGEIGAAEARELDAEIALARAVACRSLGQPEKALEFLDLAARSTRHDPGELALERIATLRVALRLDEAFRFGLRQLDDPPSLPHLRKALADSVWSVGVQLDRTKELAQVTAAVERWHLGDDTHWHIRSAIVAFAAGDFARAVASWKAAQAHRSKLPDLESAIAAGDPSALKALRQLDQKLSARAR